METMFEDLKHCVMTAFLTVSKERIKTANLICDSLMCNILLLCDRPFICWSHNVWRFVASVSWVWWLTLWSDFVLHADIGFITFLFLFFFTLGWLELGVWNTRRIKYLCENDSFDHFCRCWKFMIFSQCDHRLTQDFMQTQLTFYILSVLSVT